MHLGRRDLRDVPLVRRKALLHDLLPSGRDGILVADHIVGRGVDLFAEIRRRDCEGIVGKWARSPYRLLAGKSPWVKILNGDYGQRVGRHEFFHPGATRP